MDKETIEFLYERQKEAYQQGFEKAEKLLERFSFLASQLVLLGAGAGYLLGNYQHGLQSCHQWFFYLAMLVMAGFFVAAVWMLLAAHGSGTPYSYIADPLAVTKRAEELSDWAVTTMGADAVVELKRQLAIGYGTFADKNIKTNRARMAKLVAANKFAIRSFAALTLGAMFYVAGGVHSDTPSVKVQITEPISINK